MAYCDWGNTKIFQERSNWFGEQLAEFDKDNHILTKNIFANII